MIDVPNVTAATGTLQASISHIDHAKGIFKAHHTAFMGSDVLLLPDNLFLGASTMSSLGREMESGGFLHHHDQSSRALDQEIEKTNW